MDKMDPSPKKMRIAFCGSCGLDFHHDILVLIFPAIQGSHIPEGVQRTYSEHIPLVIGILLSMYLLQPVRDTKYFLSSEIRWKISFFPEGVYFKLILTFKMDLMS